MKIEFLTQEDPLYIQPLFEEFLRHYSDRFEITRISVCKVMGNRSRRKLLREMAELYGLVGLARLLSRIAAARILGRLPAERSARRYFSMPQLAKAYGIEYVPVKDPNSPEFLATVSQRRSDSIISVACPYILRSGLLSLPPLGCINIHHAPLPRYKGMMPTFWQLYQGEKSVGLTIHRMTEKLDDGAPLLQEQLPVQKNESLHQLIRRSKRSAAHALARVLEGIASNTLVTGSAIQEKGTYFTFPTLHEIREFRRRGLRAI